MHSHWSASSFAKWVEIWSKMLYTAYHRNSHQIKNVWAIFSHNICLQFQIVMTCSNQSYVVLCGFDENEVKVAVLIQPTLCQKFALCERDNEHGENTWWGRWHSCFNSVVYFNFSVPTSNKIPWSVPPINIASSVRDKLHSNQPKVQSSL